MKKRDSWMRKQRAEEARDNKLEADLDEQQIERRFEDEAETNGAF